jgi:hypothetical protein
MLTHFIGRDTPSPGPILDAAAVALNVSREVVQMNFNNIAEDEYTKFIVDYAK